MKKIVCLLLLLMPLLCGCSTAIMERQIYPICLSVDETEDGGFCIGIQVPRSNTGDTVSYEILTATGDTLESALRTLSASTAYPLNFSQIRLCMISYHVASTTHLRPLLRTLLNLPSMRPMAYVSIALGRALDVMQYQQPEFGMRLSTHLGLLFSRTRSDLLLPDSTLSYCVRELEDGACDPLIGICAVNADLAADEKQQDASPAFSAGEPWGEGTLPGNLVAGMLPNVSQNPVEYLGAAALSEGCVSGLLTAEETRLCLALESQAELRTAREGDALQLQIVLPRDSALWQEQQDILDLLQRLKALHSDPLHFGCVCSMGFFTNAAFERFGFRQKYAEASLWIGMK